MLMNVPEGAEVRSVDQTNFGDLTDAVQTDLARWVNETTIEIPFDTEPSTDEQAAIRLRLLTRDAEQEARVVAMRKAVAALKQSPTTPTELRDGLVLALTELLGDLA